MISLVFIRHGATEGNLFQKYIGRTDEPLCEKGIRQALKLKDNNFPKEHIFVSPMKRTIQTAELIFPKSKYVIEENFKEMDFGIFENKNAFDLGDSVQYRLWVDSMCTLPVPGGESVTGFKKRCIDAFDKIVTLLPDNSKASFVIHGGVIMSILEAFARPKRSFYDYHIKNGEYLCCRFEDGIISIV